MALFPVRTIKQLLLGVAALALGLSALSGCDQTGYSPDMRYPPRTDPLYKEKEPGAELEFPDRPGQLPVLSLAQADDPTNPLYIAAKANGLVDPRKLDAQQREKLVTGLEQNFGTPARPKVNGISDEARTGLKLDDQTLEQGSRLYRIQCLHCHGLPGDGRGPTAFWVNPHPRDYRLGIFKFQSTPYGSSPSRKDLLRTLREGIDGSSMPSFGLLPDDELEALVSYVIHLSLRGQVEALFIRDVLIASDTGDIPGSIAVYGSRWLDAQKPSAVMQPEPFPDEYAKEPERKAAVQRGWGFFNDKEAGCVACHTDYGRKSKFRYDQWGTLVHPADLTTGIYRGGRRPIDLYWRMQGGINGSGMASFGEVLARESKLFAESNGKKGKVKSPWDVILFLEILPYPQMRAKYGVQID